MRKEECFHGLEGLSQVDQALVSRFGRGPSLAIPHSLVHAAFEAIVDFHPTIIAAKIGDQTITYQQLDIASNRLAHHLIDSGLKPRQRVCLVVQRSFEMLIGIFAILKAGCQYVPIDGGVASEQALDHIFTDTGARFILCLPKFWDKVRRFARRDAIIFALGMDIGAFYSSERPRVQVSSQDGIYAIYTSGSTGKPKGVDVSHENVTNALLLEPARLGITVGSKVAQVLNISFDMGAWEILACLMNGGTLYLRGSDWAATLSQIDTLISTPSILSKYKRSSFPNIKTVVTGGEPCPQIVADEWAENTTYYNICGPTEITILNSAHRHTPQAPLTIGRPIPNTTCYILDDDMQPDLTSSRYQCDKFLDNRYVFRYNFLRKVANMRQIDDVQYRRCSGLEEGWKLGYLCSLGKDDQVKVKGFRIQLDGITTISFQKFPGVTKATTMLFDGKLHGFYATDTPIIEEDLDAHVRKHLPFYSVPDRWTFVASIPLTANGKINKQELSQLAIASLVRADSGVDNPSPLKEQAPTSTTVELYQPPTNVVDTPRDLEKGSVVVSNRSSNLSAGFVVGKKSTELDSSNGSSMIEVPDTLPEKNGLHGGRWLRHRAFILYRKFLSIVILSNLAVACFLLYRKIKQEKFILADLATATAANLCVAVLMRSEPVVNLLFTVFCSVPTWFPLAIRRHCARIFHIGGIHSGCAIAAIVWFTIFTISASLELVKPLELRRLSLAPLILSYLVLVIFIGIGATSHPTFRAKYHNAWEMTHRFGGWTSLILLWVQTFLATKDLNRGIAPSKAYLNAPPVWLLTVATMAIIFPWVFLRKVAVRSEVLSNHAIRLWFDYTTPIVGTAVRLAERPLVDWHGFATITNPEGQKGFSLIVSRAGDFTGRTIERAPTHIYVRGIPTCGVLRIATLFKSVVLVATGSGIGPCLAVILAQKIPCRILWTAPNPEETFGKEIIDSVKKTDPHALIWNTRTEGKPNMSLLAYKMWKESGAEAVCVISNKRFTTKIVYDMEARGIPAYGAIFDS